MPLRFPLSRLSSVISLLVVLFAAAAFAGSGEILRVAEPVFGQYIVVFDDSVADPASLAQELASQHGAVVNRVYSAALKGFAIHASEAGARGISADPRVQYVEENGVVRMSPSQNDATWGLDRIDQRDLPLDLIYTYNVTGAGVKAYIIDTGIRVTHTEFGGRAIHGTDKVDNDNDASDCNGHGTHVAGTVGGGTYGVAKDATLVAVRVLDCGGSGTNDGVIAGVDWVTADHQAGQLAVANMSLGGGASQSLNDAVRNSVNDGVVYAVAAGNGYGNACDGSPAQEASAMTIGATERNDREAAYSDRGACLDMWAPGTDITSAWHTDDNATNTISGTSMATPHVAGAAALYLQSNPSATPADVDNGLSANATTGKVVWTDFFGIKPPPPPAGQDYLLYSAFISPPGPPPLPPLPPLDLGTTPVAWNQINLAWSDGSDNEDGFKIERCTGVGCSNFAQIASVGANVTTYNNTGLSGATTYRYRVRAYNGGGNSDYSNESEATTPEAPVPNAPSNLSANGGRKGRSRFVDLSWTDNSSDETSFRIERCTGAGCINFVEISSVGANVTTFRDGGLGASTTYRYRVKARNAQNLDSLPSNVAETTTP